VYGVPSRIPVAETAQTAPINPYGRSKLMTEWMLEDTANSFLSAPDPATQPQDRFRYVALRYFNVAGASRDGSLGQATPNATHLIKVACEAACGKRESISIYGTDYPTPDGTCIRDYIHVVDLAEAHILALKALASGHATDVYNVGTGQGYSNLEVIKMIEKVAGKKVKLKIGPRRPGDANELVADPGKINREFGWQPQHSDLETIVATAWHWHKNHI